MCWIPSYLHQIINETTELLQQSDVEGTVCMFTICYMYWKLQVVTSYSKAVNMLSKYEQSFFIFSQICYFFFFFFKKSLVSLELELLEQEGKTDQICIFSPFWLVVCSDAGGLCKVFN